MTIKQRLQHNDIPSDLLEAAGKRLGAEVCKLAGFDQARLKSVKMFDPAMEGRTGAELDFDPPLTDEENRRMQAAVRSISERFGARAPIFPAKA